MLADLARRALLMRSKVRGLTSTAKAKISKSIKKGYRVRVWLNGRDCVGPLRVTLERAQQDLARVHACREWFTKKAKLLELMKAAGNGVVRRGRPKTVPCAGVEAQKELTDDVVPADGVPKVAAFVVKKAYMWKGREKEYKKEYNARHYKANAKPQTLKSNKPKLVVPQTPEESLVKAIQEAFGGYKKSL